MDDDMENYFLIFIGILAVCLVTSVLLFKKNDKKKDKLHTKENFDCDAYCSASAILPIGFLAPGCNCQL